MLRNYNNLITIYNNYFSEHSLQNSEFFHVNAGVMWSNRILRVNLPLQECIETLE
jgi:hypothetical protein